MTVKSSYQETLDYLYAVLPMYQRVGAIAYKRDLTNTIALCNALDNPERKFKTVHVGGTNGKGSSSHMLAAILQSEGYKTGLYTSPHLKEFTERIRIDGIEISKDYVVEFVRRIKPQIEIVKPSFFEITVAMAFDYFAAQQVEIAIIEVGLGGRLDSTNVIDPMVSLITNIGFDHKDILGDTLEAIAREKAGIIKKNRPVVISERQAEIEHVFINKANESAASIVFAQDDYEVRKVFNEISAFEVRKGKEILFPQLKSELTGGYQRKNITGVLAVVDQLRKQGMHVSDESITGGISQTVTLTGLKGRWQKLGDHPLMYCDTAHNGEGIVEVMQLISELTFKKLHIVFGMVKDKDSHAVLSLLPKDAIYYFCEAKIPRALDANTLAMKAKEHDLIGHAIADVNEAIRMAKMAAADDDLIFIGGSTFVVAEIEAL